MGGRIDRAALTDSAVNLANVVRAMKQASKVT
jgi:hypothetical protein